MPANASCILAYTSSIPYVNVTPSTTVLNNLYVVDGLGYQTIAPQFGVTLKPFDSMGRLIFKSQGNPNVTDLDLHPNENGSLTLHNIGEATITNIKLTFADQNGNNQTFANYF